MHDGNDKLGLDTATRKGSVGTYREDVQLYFEGVRPCIAIRIAARLCPSAQLSMHFLGILILLFLAF